MRDYRLFDMNFVGLDNFPFFILMQLNNKQLISFQIKNLIEIRKDSSVLLNFVKDGGIYFDSSSIFIKRLLSLLMLSFFQVLPLLVL